MDWTLSFLHPVEDVENWVLDGAMIAGTGSNPYGELYAIFVDFRGILLAFAIHAGWKSLTIAH